MRTRTLLLHAARGASRNHPRASSSLRKLPSSVMNNRSNLSHEERTAADPREVDAHSVIVHKLHQINQQVRLIQLRNVDPDTSIKAIQFQPGQWLDVHVPGVIRAGGFTITSTPNDAEGKDGYLELAIQLSPKNPPAAWLWQKKKKILDQELLIRVGGRFVWPPPGIEPSSIKRLVFVAGGVGINPLISILTHLQQNPTQLPDSVHFLYTNRALNQNIKSTLFLDRLQSFFASYPSPSNKLTLFYTPHKENLNGIAQNIWRAKQKEFMNAERKDGKVAEVAKDVDEKLGRIEQKDLFEALGPVEERGGVVAYVCGPPQMTDWAVEEMGKAEGMRGERVLCEKWW